jgi:hypothetical protein
MTGPEYIIRPGLPLVTRNPGYICWRLVLKCYELRTRQHKMLDINALHPLKHYLHKDLMNFGRRPRARYHEGYTFVIRVIKQCRMKYKKYET